MRKIIGIILAIMLVAGILTGCGTNTSGAAWGTNIHEYKGHEYLVFTSSKGGIYVIEVEEQ